MALQSHRRGTAGERGQRARRSLAAGRQKGLRRRLAPASHACEATAVPWQDRRPTRLRQHKPAGLARLSGLYFNCWTTVEDAEERYASVSVAKDGPRALQPRLMTLRAMPACMPFGFGFTNAGRTRKVQVAEGAQSFLRTSEQSSRGPGGAAGVSGGCGVPREHA